MVNIYIIINQKKEKKNKEKKLKGAQNMEEKEQTCSFDRLLKRFRENTIIRIYS